MVEFAQTYGLWIALAGVFIAMHWFGMGCCGRRDGRKPTQGNEDIAGETPGGEKAPKAGPKSGGSCH